MDYGDSALHWWQTMRPGLSQFMGQLLLEKVIPKIQKP